MTLLPEQWGGGDENSSSDMGSLIQNCDNIRNDTGAHVCLIHHTGKEETRGARGHSSLKAAIDTEIQVSQKNEIIQATILKQREGRTGDRLCFSFKGYEVRRDEDNDPVYSCALTRVDIQSEKNQLSGQALQAYQLLSDFVLDKGIEHIPEEGMPLKKCVRTDDFKDRFIKSNIASSDKPGSINKAFLRAKNTLKNERFIEEWDGYLWTTDKPDM